MVKINQEKLDNNMDKNPDNMLSSLEKKSVKTVKDFYLFEQEFEAKIGKLNEEIVGDKEIIDNFVSILDKYLKIEKIS